LTSIAGQDIVVGDIVFVEPGRVILCEGIIVTGRGLACENQERDKKAQPTKKVTMDHLIKLRNNRRKEYIDCFVCVGDNVIEGTGRYVVTTVNKVEDTPPPRMRIFVTLRLKC
jgi:Ca2+-transporting ATPase